MKYFLCTFENRSFEPFKEITENEFVEIKNNINIISDYYSHFLIFVYFDQNLKDFNRLIKKLSNIPSQNLSIESLNSAVNLMGLNQYVINILSAFKFYIDNAETHIKRQFGKKSNEAKEYKLQTNKYFDNNFEYRFLSKLRNYSLHLGFPLKRVTYRLREEAVIPNNMIGDIKLFVKTSRLLKESKLFGKIVTEDFLKIDGDIDLVEQINNLGCIILEFEKLIFSKHAINIDNASRFFKELAGSFKTKDNEIVAYYNLTKTNEGKINFSTLTLPFSDIEEINKLNNWH